MLIGFSGSSHGTVPAPTRPDTVLDVAPAAPSTVPTNRFSTLLAGRTRPTAMVKRKVNYEDSSEDSPSSRDSTDYTDQLWTGGSSNSSDWRTLSWAFGLGPSSSSAVVGRRRGRRGTRKARGATPEEEKDTMAELLEIVLWNDEKEIDLTEELEDDADDDSDDEDLEAIKRMMNRQETIRPRVTMMRERSGGVKSGEEKMGKVLSVSCLRFDSLLNIGSPAETTKKQSIMRVERRTSTMERAFKGVLDESYIAEVATSSSMDSGASSMLAEKTASSSTLVQGDEENFWDDVEF